MTVPVSCIVCGKITLVQPFFAADGPRNRKYCSRACSHKDRKPAQVFERTCQQCGVMFTVKKSNKKHKGFFCTPACYHQHRIESLPIETIIHLYTVEEKSIYEIGSKFGVHGVTIQYRLQKFGIKRRTASEVTKGDKNPLHKKGGHTQASRKKMRESHANQFSDPETRNRHGELTARQIAEGRTGKSNNKLEKRFAALLQDAELVYQQGFLSGRCAFDFYLPEYNIIIECDGTFWHADPRFYPDRDRLTKIQQKNIANDARKDEYARSKGFCLIRFWEFDIHNNTEHVLHALKDATAKKETK